MTTLPQRFFFVLAFAGAAVSQDAPNAAASACNADTINWVLPGNFEQAVARGKAEGRLLLIKGVSFGIDEIGSKCATKGKW